MYSCASSVSGELADRSRKFKTRGALESPQKDSSAFLQIRESGLQRFKFIYGLLCLYRDSIRAKLKHVLQSCSLIKHIQEKLTTESDLQLIASAVIGTARDAWPRAATTDIFFIALQQLHDRQSTRQIQESRGFRVCQ